MAATETSNNKNEVVSYLTMRKTVGWLGMLLPFLLLAGNFALNHLGVFDNDWFVQKTEGYKYESLDSFKGSVSHYYYTTVGEIFTGTLCAVALFLFCYSGHPLRKGEKGFSDSTMTTLAGIFALGVVLFPTSSEPLPDNLRHFLSSWNVGIIHLIFAGLFFLTLAIMSMVNFRRSEKQELFGTGPDDPFFLWCGIVMLACMVLVFIFSELETKFEWLVMIRSTFVFEAIALIAFGLSWLKKGRADLMYIPKKLNLAGNK